MEELQFEASKSLKQMNQYLEDVGKTPVKRKKLQSKKYLDKKLDEVTEMLKKVTIGDTDSVRTTDESEMLGQLKEKFHATKESSVKIQILTGLPKSWSTRRIEREFSVSHHISWKVKSPVKEKRESFDYLIQSLGTHSHKKLPTWLLPFMKVMSPVG